MSAGKPASVDGEVLVLGVDCAARAKGVGLARAVWRARVTYLLDVERGRGELPMTAFAAPRLARWIQGWTGPVVLGLDAPLGWPGPLSDGLRDHVAGASFAAEPEDPHRLWRRTTDLLVRRRTGKNPLEVGADRIARAAKATLDLLHDVRELTGRAFPVALEPGVPERDCTLEVYPAATRLAHAALPRDGKKTDEDVRMRIARALTTLLRMEAEQVDALTRSDHELDAGLCVLAASDVLNGEAVAPTRAERADAAREGWIWVRPADAR